MDANRPYENITDMDEADRSIPYKDKKLAPLSESWMQNPYQPQSSVSASPPLELQPQRQHSSFPSQQFQRQQPQLQPWAYQEQEQGQGQAQITSNIPLHRSITCPVPNHLMIAHGDYGEPPPPNNPYCNFPKSNLGCPPPNSNVCGNGEDAEEILANASCIKRTRYRIGKAIESKTAHIAILVLTLCDIILVMLQIGASLLHLDETEHEHWVLALFEHLSLAIVSVFMLEILLKIFAFGPRYFWIGTPNWILHLVDAFIIVTSFLLEIFLKGAEQELSSLLIVFRLWRVVKLTGTVAIEVSEHDQAHVALLEERVKLLEQELEESHLKIQSLEGFNLRRIEEESKESVHIE